MTRVVFLCAHNDARSQMAEGFLRALSPDRIVESAGTVATRVHPLAIAVMKEDGIDISGQRSKTVGMSAKPPSSSNQPTISRIVRRGTRCCSAGR